MTSPKIHVLGVHRPSLETMIGNRLDVRMSANNQAAPGRSRSDYYAILDEAARLMSRAGLRTAKALRPNGTGQLATIEEHLYNKLFPTS